MTKFSFQTAPVIRESFIIISRIIFYLERIDKDSVGDTMVVHYPWGGHNRVPQHLVAAAILVVSIVTTGNKTKHWRY